MVWHNEAFVQESMLDVTLRVQYNTAKACNMTQYYSYRTKGTFTSTDRVTGKLLMWEIKLFHKTAYRKLPTLLSFREYCSSSSLASVKRKEISKSIQVTCQCEAATYNTVSLAIYCRYISETSHGYNKSATYPYNLHDMISLRDIVLVRLLCNNISQSKRYIVAAKFVVTICRSELRFNDLS